MFKHLFDFSYKRNFVEAIGFYIAYLFLLLIVNLMVSYVLVLLSMILRIHSLAGFESGKIVRTIASLFLSALILHKRNRFQNFGLVLLGIFSGFVGYFGGLLLSLIPIAFLSTRKK